MTVRGQASYNRPPRYNYTNTEIAYVKELVFQGLTNVQIVESFLIQFEVPASCKRSVFSKVSRTCTWLAANQSEFSVLPNPSRRTTIVPTKLCI